ncbi:hypothetical protein KFE25_000357 [Diacronema lutheri]|uniref:Uncharacterized protein n=2 Tax=Diacronema lutheri TaxID=2081491 RepID=A0A8J5XPM6_DIALT|nr:hypothetical protein KFE25_000357 [Diacronema lutheri]
MGKNAGKPVRHTGGSGGGQSYEEAWEKREFHSKAYQQQEVQLLLNAPERLSWDEWKAQQQKKKDEEEAQFYGVGMDMMKYRQQLDDEREKRLNERREANEQTRHEREGDKRDKKSKKRGKDKGKDKRKGKDKKSKGKDSGVDASSGSSSSDEQTRRKKGRAGEADKGPVKLSSFFNAHSDDEDAL